VSASVVKGVVKIAEDIGKIVADEVKNNMTESEKEAASANPYLQAAKEIGQSTLFAVGTIWNSLENAGDTLVNSTTTKASNIVEHKYGPDAARVAEDIGSISVNAYKTTRNIRSLGAKSLLKKVARKGAVKASKEYLKSTEQPPKPDLDFPEEEVDDEIRHVPIQPDGVEPIDVDQHVGARSVIEDIDEDSIEDDDTQPNQHEIEAEKAPIEVIGDQIQ